MVRAPTKQHDVRHDRRSDAVCSGKERKGRVKKKYDRVVKMGENVLANVAGLALHWCSTGDRRQRGNISSVFAW